MQYGTITADQRDAGRLEDMGIELGPYVGDEFTECVVTDGALEKLDPWWGLFYWELHHRPTLHKRSEPTGESP